MFYKLYKIVNSHRKYYSGCYDGIPHFSINKRNGVAISKTDIETVTTHLMLLQKSEIHCTPNY